MNPSSPQPAFNSTHARYAAHAAAELGYAFQSLDGADGYLFEVRDGARKALFAVGSGSPFAFNTALAAALARDKAFCATALRRAGVATAPGEMFFVTRRHAEMRTPGREIEDARAYVARAERPLFCKPIDGSRGAYAEIITDAQSFEDYLRRVRRAHFAILIQPVMRGREHRVLVLNGGALFSYAKCPPQLTGDGTSRLRDLARALREEHAPAPARLIARDPSGRAYEGDDIPPHGVTLQLEGPANRAVGGSTEAPDETPPAQLAQIGIAATAAVGLSFAGVDVFDLSPARDLSDLCVIEVNANPMFKTLEDYERWDIITRIWRANFEAALK